MQFKNCQNWGLDRKKGLTLGLEESPVWSAGKVDFAARQLTFHACLPDRQEPKPQVPADYIYYKFKTKSKRRKPF